MINSQIIKGITDLRSNPLAITQLAKSQGPVYILNRSTPTSVLMDVDEYEELLDRLQDSIDALEIMKIKESGQKIKWTTSEEIKKKINLK